MMDERPSFILSRLSLSILGVLFYHYEGSLGLEIGFVLHLSHLMAQGSKPNHEKKAPL
jgi:hypothetical protein